MEKRDILEILIDKDNNDPIVFTNEKGERLVFEQVGVIYVDKIYCLLKPLSEIEGVGSNGIVIFYVDERDGETNLVVETDREKAMSVFNNFFDVSDEN